MFKKIPNSALRKNAHIHIDKIHFTGPCRHKPLGKVFFKYDEEVGFTATGASSNRKKLAGRADDAYIQSKDVEDEDTAYKIDISCCPTKVLQKQNVFGHSSVVDYGYAVFDHLTRALGIEVDPHDREEWRNGGVSITEIHLTGNFGCPEQHLLPIIDAIDANNATGKLRSLLTCITLGYTGRRRSKYHMLTIYGKLQLLERDWKHPGKYQSKLIEYVRNSIRGEIKLYSMELKARDLQYGANWRDVDVAALFFELFAKYKVSYAIQPLLTEGELAVLSKAELNAYELWLAGKPLEKQFKSRTTVGKHVKSIYQKTGIDVGGDRRPEALPPVHLGDIFRPENVLPIPDWAFGTEYYFPPVTPDLPPRKWGGEIDKVPVDPDAVDE